MLSYEPLWETMKKRNISTDMIVPCSQDVTQPLGYNHENGYKKRTLLELLFRSYKVLYYFFRIKLFALLRLNYIAL